MSATAAEADTDPIKRAQRVAWKRGLAVSNELRKSARALRATSAKPAPAWARISHHARALLTAIGMPFTTADGDRRD